MQKFIFLICAVFLFSPARAVHIKGGLIQYEYLSPGASGTSLYRITVNVFRSCTDAGPMPTALVVYDAVTYATVQTIPNTGNLYLLTSTPTKTSFHPCLSNPPAICYQVYTYTTTLTLQDNTNGYIIAAQDANRVRSIVNVVNSSATGISFTATIPGIINGVDYHVNSSPSFLFKDTAVICYSSRFEYQFSATDADGDVLTYSFGNGLNGTQAPSKPPFSPLNYTAGFSGAFPLGSGVKIDSTSGLISGIAPATTGEYIIAVYVHEWRNGIIINSTKKELQITVANCTISAVTLKPLYINCNSYQFLFQNESVSSNVSSYAWDFGIQNITTDTSTKAAPLYTYLDTGTYTLKITVGNASGCKDSAEATVKVYPGFTPSFTVDGNCSRSPFRFTDNSFVKYGSIDSRAWDFGDTNTADDTSSIVNPSYKYPAAETAIVMMSITSTVGCAGIYSDTITIQSTPYLFMPFTDTLICSIDSLVLNAQSGPGTYQWKPNYNISAANIVRPFVFPKDTTIYTFTVTDNGCIDSVKVKVNVLDFITVKLSPDTGVCKTDMFMLHPVSDALSYRWRESTNSKTLDNYFIKNPLAGPLVTTTYYVTANLGYCQDSAKTTVHVSPYPVAKLPNDTVICFGSRIQINGTISGAYFSWSNSTTLVNTNTLHPLAGPGKNTSYVLTVKDTMYCPKEVSDTILIKVIPLVAVNAGRDTAVSLGQPLQLLATGADASYNYEWLPNIYLDYNGIFNPVCTVTSTTVDSIKYIVKVTTQDGCTTSDDIVVRVYRNGPEILVPGAFTPNGDGRNDVIRPILIGITQLDFFMVYNRWGQLIYSSSSREAAWDGSFNGAKQQSGSYIYSVSGKDFNSKTIYRKGSFVLIR
jgi:gliding motility-associated-like protein